MKRITVASSVLALTLLAVVFVYALGPHSQITMADTQKAKKTEKKLGQKPSQKKIKDPVCGMEVDPKSAAGNATYKGKTYYFCSVEDKEQFEKSPEKYVK